MTDIRVLEIDYTTTPSSGDVPQVDSSGNWAPQPVGVPVGAVLMGFYTSAPTGWVLLQGSTIGKATSGATNAHVKYENLFVHLWNSLSNTEAPVSSGRGASGAADFAAGKTLTLPDMRQRFPIGKSGAGTGATLGGTGGAIDHTHSVPAHYHGMGTGADLNITSSGSHQHSLITRDNATAFGVNDLANANSAAGSARTNTDNINAASHTHAAGSFAGKIGLVTGGVDGNAAMTSGTNNPPFLAFNFIIKY